MRPRSRQSRGVREVLFRIGAIACLVAALGVLAVLLGSILVTAAPMLRPELVTNFPSTTNPWRAGYWPAIVGTLYVVALTLLFALPLGVAAGIYLEEYAPPGRLTRLLQAGVANLAGVPSVVFGLLGLALFVRPPLALGPSVIAAALTLTLLVFPYVVVTTQESLRAVPRSLREASLAIGATRWQTIRGQVVPAAAPGLLTGSILAASRALGETAPLIVLGSVVLLTIPPWDLSAPFVVLSVQIYAFIGLPGAGFQAVAAAGMVVLLGMLLLFNGLAIVARNRLQRKR